MALVRAPATPWEGRRGHGTVRVPASGCSVAVRDRVLHMDHLVLPMVSGRQLLDVAAEGAVPALSRRRGLPGKIDEVLRLAGLASTRGRRAWVQQEGVRVHQEGATALGRELLFALHDTDFSQEPSAAQTATSGDGSAGQRRRTCWVAPSSLYVASAAFEGRTSPLGALGNANDAVHGRLQIAYGRATSAAGLPVVIVVLTGDTGDPETVAPEPSPRGERSSSACPTGPTCSRSSTPDFWRLAPRGSEQDRGACRRPTFEGVVAVVEGGSHFELLTCTRSRAEMD